MSDTIDFGASKNFGSHHFYVDIPAEPKAAVSIYEDYGFDGDETRRETTETRVILARELWTKIRDDARRDFNDRLKAKKQGSGTWRIGKVKLDRFLGRELCVLAWAAEHATKEECAVICQKWLALRPEERWWLFSKTSSEAGLADQKDRGWRKALYCALSDGRSIKVKTKIKPRLRKREEQENMSLLSYIKEMTDDNCALSDGRNIKVKPRTKPRLRKRKKQENMSLLDYIKEMADDNKTL